MFTASTELMQLTNSPEVFGLHPNAEIGYYTQAAREMWNHLIELQPQTGNIQHSRVHSIVLTKYTALFYFN